MTWAEIQTALGHVWELVTGSIDFMKENVLLMTMVVACLIPIGFRIFKKAKRACK